MKVLLVGNRAIQHALAARLSHEGCMVDVYPGQPFGAYTTVTETQILKTPYDLVVMGSPRYFNNQMIREVVRRGAAFFGPDAATGLLETSKDSFKGFAASCGIRTPSFQSFVRLDEATDYVRSRRGPFVIKADGPARGCGVAICATPEQAVRDLMAKLQDQSSLYYSSKVVIEDFVQGFEVAANIFLDDDSYVVLPPTKPHKRRDTGDAGPNVAGMGSAAGFDLSPCFFEDCMTRLSPRQSRASDRISGASGGVFSPISCSPTMGYPSWNTTAGWGTPRCSSICCCSRAAQQSC